MTVGKVELELKNIAKELNLALENPKVPVEWCKRGGSYNDEIFVKLIAPLYFPSPEYEIVINDDGRPAAVKAEDYLSSSYRNLSSSLASSTSK